MPQPPIRSAESNARRTDWGGGGDISRLGKYLGHSTMRITEQVYAHLVPEDFSQDWGRVTPDLPEQAATVEPLAFCATPGTIPGVKPGSNSGSPSLYRC